MKGRIDWKKNWYIPAIIIIIIITAIAIPLLSSSDNSDGINAYWGSTDTNSNTCVAGVSCATTWPSGGATPVGQTSNWATFTNTGTCWIEATVSLTGRGSIFIHLEPSESYTWYEACPGSCGTSTNKAYAGQACTVQITGDWAYGGGDPLAVGYTWSVYAKTYYSDPVTTTTTTSAGTTTTTVTTTNETATTTTDDGGDGSNGGTSTTTTTVVTTSVGVFDYPTNNTSTGTTGEADNSVMLFTFLIIIFGVFGALVGSTLGVWPPLYGIFALASMAVIFLMFITAAIGLNILLLGEVVDQNDTLFLVGARIANLFIYGLGIALLLRLMLRERRRA